MRLVAITDRLLRATPFHRLVRSVFRAIVRPRRVRRCYRQFVRPGDLAFDVGANVGSRTDALLRLGARVVAVEPQPAIAAVLRRRFAGNRRFALEQAAIGAREREAPMYVCSLHDLTTLSRDRMETARRRPEFAHAVWTEEVTRVTTLDALIRKHGRPAFIKIDVEGFEAEVLQGLSVPIRLISFEVTPQRPQGALETLHEVARLGLAAFNISFAEEMTFRFTKWLTQAEIEAFCMRELPRAIVYGDVYAMFL